MAAKLLKNSHLWIKFSRSEESAYRVFGNPKENSFWFSSVASSSPLKLWSEHWLCSQASHFPALLSGEGCCTSPSTSSLTSLTEPMLATTRACSQEHTYTTAWPHNFGCFFTFDICEYSRWHILKQTPQDNTDLHGLPFFRQGIVIPGIFCKLFPHS